MGNKKVCASGLQFFLMPAQLPKRIFDPHLLFDQATELDRAKVDIPDMAVNLFEPDVLAAAVVIDNAGHAANMDQPEAFNAAVRALLEQL